MSDLTTLDVMESAVDSYRGAPYELHALPYDYGRNKATRTGITRPGYVARAVYEFDGSYYVFDDGKLVPVADWHGAEANVLPEHREAFREARQGRLV